MSKRTYLIDAILRIGIFTWFCLYLAKVYTNFEYSLVSYTLFAFTFMAVALPIQESIAVFLLVIVLNRIFPEIYPAKIFVLNIPPIYKISILNKILLFGSFTPVFVFVILKKIWMYKNRVLGAITGIFISWSLYAFLIPFIYTISAGITTDNTYLALVKYLFARNIIIHITLAIFICIVATFICSVIEKRNTRLIGSKLK